MRERPSRAKRAGSWFGGTRRPVDVEFEHNRTPDGFGRRRACDMCGEVHRESTPCLHLVVRAGDPSHNGPYRGPCKVVVLPAGVTGADLVRRRNGHGPTRAATPRPGQVWSGPAMSTYVVYSVRRQRVTLRPTDSGRQINVPVSSMLRDSRWQLIAEGS